MAILYMAIISLIMIVTYHIREIFRNVNIHFSEVNIKRIRIIALIFVFFPLMQYLASFFATKLIQETIQLWPRIELTPFFSIGLLASALGLLAVI